MPDSTLSYQVNRLQGKVDSLDVGHGQQAITLAEHEVKIETHTEQIGGLTTLMAKVIWALVFLSLTIAGSAVTVALTVGTS